MPRRNVIEETATAGRCAECATGVARGTSGRSGGRARGELSIDVCCLRTGNVSSATPIAPAAKLCAKRSAARRLPRKWSKTFPRRYGRSVRSSPSRSGSRFSDQ